jgi:5-methylcytosine-specific restriction endonuclease McrA
MKKVKVKRSSKWAYWRRKHLKIEPTCQWCGGGAGYLQVHHVVPVHVDASLELEMTNLITLCETPNYNCHRRVGHLGNWRLYNENVRKDCKERQESRMRVKLNA